MHWTCYSSSLFANEEPQGQVMPKEAADWNFRPDRVATQSEGTSSGCVNLVIRLCVGNRASSTETVRRVMEFLITGRDEAKFSQFLMSPILIATPWVQWWNAAPRHLAYRCWLVQLCPAPVTSFRKRALSHYPHGAVANRGENLGDLEGWLVEVKLC
ncbi:hypothetical protein NPIL_304281 [Nephila pilipes]|uniref:Uncharacterized protein n=1 Tax=Nephila pilipes TaxID=299642 RepID=A0A8X6UDA2_NEPPI|nr:hypothetical protein NPIL_304281 [Nephila pilipes]